MQANNEEDTAHALDVKVPSEIEFLDSFNKEAMCSVKSLKAKQKWYF